MRGSTHICVARHGETDWNIAGILQGWIDVPINERGRQQALELAAACADTGFAVIATSPLARSRETAEIMAAAMNLAPPMCYDGLKERNFGAIQGVPKSELASLHPELLRQILERDPCAEFPQGESMHPFADRVLAALSAIDAEYHGKRVLLITHGWVMDVITRHINGLQRQTILDMKRRNGESIWLEVAGQLIRPLDGPP